MTVRKRGYTDWSWYGKCPKCPAESGGKCIDRRKRSAGFVRYADTPHKGRVKRNDSEH
jgi:hypothetical protein